MGDTGLGAGAAGLAAVLLAGGGACFPPPDHPGDVPGCHWQVDIPNLKLPAEDVFGTLMGPSRNAATSCGAARGPEAVYLLELTERRLVDLVLGPETDMMVAVRRNCADPATELACDRQGLRKVLDPGRYFVVIDQPRASEGLRAFYSLQARAVPPFEAGCASALPVGGALSVANESMDLAVEPAPSCNGGPSRPARYYRATIPSGQRLTARAASADDRRWTPVLQLLDGCGPQATCLATDRLAEDSVSVLRYVNNGARDQQVVLAVGGTSLPPSARFDMVIDVARPLGNQTCQSAAELADGLALPAQDLSEGGADPTGRCRRGDRSLFYRVRLRQRQTLRLTVDRRLQRPFGNPLLSVAVRDGCSEGCGQPVTFDEVLSLTHVDPGPRDYVIEMSDVVFRSLPNRLFDLSARVGPARAADLVAPLQLGFGGATIAVE